MTIRVVRVGNTLSVEIPEEMAAQASLAAGDPVEWRPDGSGSIALLRAGRSGRESSAPRVTLEELLEGLEEGTSLGEFDWGPARGVEVW